MKATKRIVLVAHDERKEDLLVWARRNTAYEPEFKDYGAYIRRPM